MDLRIGGQFGIGRIGLGLECLCDAFALRQKIILLQTLGHSLLNFLHPGRHTLAQLPALASRQAQGQGLLGLLKVVQITQVWRHGSQGGLLVHHACQQTFSARAHLTQHQQVVALLAHLQAKTGRCLGTFLPNPGQWPTQQLRRGHKTQETGVHGQAQFGRGQFSSSHRHRGLGKT